MNFKRLMEETLVANNGELSRGLKNQLSILNAFIDESLEEKLSFLSQEAISIYSYAGLRVLEFSLNTMKNVINENEGKLDLYRTNIQELLKDLRKQELNSMENSYELMKFLQKFDFSEEQLNSLNASAPAVILDSIEKNKKLVAANLNFLMDLGVTNLQEIFLEYYDLFLLDNSNFSEIFNKYDREDLIDKLVKNVAIIEYL